MTRLWGNTRGLKTDQLRRLENLYRRRVPPEYLITPELSRDLALLRALGAHRRTVFAAVLLEAGVIASAVAAKDKTIQFEGKSEAWIKHELSDLREIARVKEY